MSIHGSATLSASQLKAILDKHLKWLNGVKGGERANLSGANLYGANLYGARLDRANLSGANLSGANLSGANLSGANLYVANLYVANLSGANLSGANLSGANLSGANLYGANLYVARLDRANIDLSILDRTSLQSCSGIVAYAQVSFSGHGECGRMLTAIRQTEESEIYFCCGCFRGNESELRDYIEHDREELKPSRLLALETVLTLIAVEKGVKA